MIWGPVIRDKQGREGSEIPDQGVVPNETRAVEGEAVARSVYVDKSRKQADGHRDSSLPHRVRCRLAREADRLPRHVSEDVRIY